LLPTFRDNISVPYSGTKNLWLILTNVSGEAIGPLFTGQESVVITDVSGQPVGPNFRDQESMVISYRRFGRPYRYHLQLLKMESIACLETSVINYQYSLRNNPEERSYRIDPIFKSLPSASPTQLTGQVPDCSKHRLRPPF